MSAPHTRFRTADRRAIAEAARILRLGGLVGFPTETVYGIGADATNDDAVARLFDAKQRPRFNPLIVHVGSLLEAEDLGQFPVLARDLAERYWPGPLTLVVPRLSSCPVSLLACAGLDTIALRSPSHPVARALLDAAKIPIAAPSANVSGRVTATRVEHVRSDFGESLDLVLDGGPAPLGLESTVIGFEAGRPVLLRPGAIPSEDISVVARIADSPRSERDGEFRSPGQLKSHYAPRARLQMNATAVTPEQALLAFGSDVPAGARDMLNLSRTRDLREAAANLFTMLRALDERGAAEIAVMPIPETGLGEAINDRLRRAMAPRGAP
jgi:L-threonylcarbamoyladenylate synthase